jgi:3-deoxy-7-phosphoheptulonate synthase
VIAVLTESCALADKARVVKTIEQAGLRASLSWVGGKTWVCVVGEAEDDLQHRLQGLPGVHEVRAESPPWPLVAKTQPQGTVVRVGPVRIGGDEMVLVAGPCAVEGEEQLLTVARAAHAAGATMLRGGAYKPRTSPYSFQGLGLEGLRLLALARKETGLPVVTECVDPQDLDAICEHADMVQVGARNMQNFRLLTAVGECRKPVLLKRGMTATLDELLHAAEYVVSAGNTEVVLCLRGIRTFERTTRNTLDLGALPWLKERCHLPVMVDPSHATGVRSFVAPLARAAVAAGADAVMVEVHPDPACAWSDGPQSLTLPELLSLASSLTSVAGAVGRTMRPALTV